MFNAPRPTQLRYQANNGLGSFVDENPLSRSAAYDSVDDPWSSTPALPPPPQLPNVFGNILAEATVPPIYRQSFDAVDPSGTAEVSVNALIRVISTSGLPASTIDRIVNLVSTRPRVSKLEFFIALALVALAQEGSDISIEQVAALARDNTLPHPTLDLSTLISIPSNSSNSSFPPAPPYNETSEVWYRDAGLNLNTSGFDPIAPSGNDAPTSFNGGLGRNWWKSQANVDVSILPEKQGFILTRYTVYQIQSDRGAPVPRRYSEFTYLFDCLVRRYPFRLIPNLPPKRLGGDGNFLEQRRKGLQRFLRFAVNHPVIREDGLLAVFLTEPSLEAWRRHASISLEEESASKRIDRVEEMSIPSDLEEKITVVRQRIVALIEQWTRVCIIAERILKRREAAAADLSRLTMTLNAVVEENPESWRADGDELYLGVRQGLRSTSRRLHVHADALERRTRLTMVSSLEALKTQRDLYIAARDLFARHDRLSGDMVDKLKKRVDNNSQKLETIKSVKKEGWAAEADKVLSSIELDQASIAAALARRVFIRHSLWHELRVVLYNRENTLLSLALQRFAREERDFSESQFLNWAALTEDLETTPLE